MKSKTYLLTLSILIASASLAHAAAMREFYFTGFKGLNVGTKEQAPQGNLTAREGRFAGAMGFQLNAAWRVESEVSMTERAPAYKDEDETTRLEASKHVAGLVNIYRDFETEGKLKPFVGAGAGYVSEDAPTDEATDNGGFAWQFGGGLKYNFDPSLSFSSAYRYLDSTDASLQEGHALRMGFSYKLPLRPKHHPRGLNDTGK